MQKEAGKRCAQRRKRSKKRPSDDATADEDDADDADGTIVSWVNSTHLLLVQTQPACDSLVLTTAFNFDEKHNTQNAEKPAQLRKPVLTDILPDMIQGSFNKY